MKPQNSYVRLSTAEYSAMVTLESEKVKKLETELEDANRKLRSDFAVERFLLNTLYLRKSAGMNWIFDFLHADFLRLHAIEVGKAESWKARFWLVFLIFVLESAYLAFVLHAK